MYHIRILLLSLFWVACVPNRVPPDRSNGVESPELNQDVGSGGRVGNGGSGVLCRSDEGKVTSIEIFDFFEARAIDRTLSFEISHDISASTPLEQAIALARYVVSTRVQSFDQALASYLNWRLDHFFEQSVLSDTPLPLTNDIEPLRAATRNCRAIQLAFTRIPDRLSPKRFHFWKLAFEHPAFSESNRAALILHELIYELTALRGASNSHGARSMIVQIFSGRYVDTFKTREEYFLFANEAKMPWAGFNRLPVKLEEPFAFWDDKNYLQFGHILPGDFVKTAIGPFRVACEVFFLRDGTATAFSFAQARMDPPGAEFELSLPDVGARKFTILPHYNRANGSDLGPPSWNDSYKDLNCPREPKYPVIVEESLGYAFFSNIEPPLVASGTSSFFNFEAHVNWAVTIRNGLISGTPSQYGQNSLTFISKHQNSPCQIEKLTESTIFLKDCVADLFNYIEPRELNIKSVERAPNPFMTVRLKSSEVESGLWVPGPRSLVNERIMIKNGSKITFDEERRIRRATVLKSSFPICVKGSVNRELIDSRDGIELTFDEQGCIEQP